MKVYEIIEYRNCDEHYSWGIYSTEENAIIYLNYMGWNDNDEFEIIEHEVDENIRGKNKKLCDTVEDVIKSIGDLYDEKK